MESNSLLHPSHHGFRAGRSTATALLELHDNWVEAFDRKEVTAVMLLDLSAAFDVVSHPILFNKLEAYGFDSGSINWIKSYLTDRQQSVYVDGILSPPLKVNIGVPQGSILGPLFLRMTYLKLSITMKGHIQINSSPHSVCLALSVVESALLQMTQHLVLVEVIPLN